MFVIGQHQHSFVLYAQIYIPKLSSSFSCRGIVHCYAGTALPCIF